MNMKVENEMALPITKSVTVMLLEPYAGKLARTVLRGESSRKGADPLDFNRHSNLLFERKSVAIIQEQGSRRNKILVLDSIYLNRFRSKLFR